MIQTTGATQDIALLLFLGWTDVAFTDAVAVDLISAMILVFSFLIVKYWSLFRNYNATEKVYKKIPFLQIFGKGGSS